MLRKNFIRTFVVACLLLSSSGLDCARAQQRPAIEVEVVTLTPRGFWPNSLSRPRGPFRLLIQNTTRTKNIPIDFVDGQSTKVKDLSIGERAGKRRSELVDLPPGRYTVRVPSQARWTLQIEIQ
jgi:hypothetical protein